MTNGVSKRLISILKIFVPLGIGIYLLWRFYTAMDATTKDVFFKAIKEANYFWIVLSMILGFCSHLARAYRWKYMLDPLGFKPKFWHRYHALMIGYLVNLLIPRAGEATRGALLYQTDRIPFAKSFGTIITERILDLLVLGFILILAITLSFDDLMSVKEIIVSGATDKGSTESTQWILHLFISLAIGGVLLFFILWLKVATFREKVNHFLNGLKHGILSIFKSKEGFKFILYTLLIWVLYLTFFALSFLAFDQTKNFPINGILIGFIAGTFGMAFTNGGIGAYPYLVGIVVIYFTSSNLITHEETEGIGKALGMVIWLSQTVLIIILGLISLLLLPRNYKKERDDNVGTNQT